NSTRPAMAIPATRDPGPVLRARAFQSRYPDSIESPAPLPEPVWRECLLPDRSRTALPLLPPATIPAPAFQAPTAVRRVRVEIERKRIRRPPWKMLLPA